MKTHRIPTDKKGRPYYGPKTFAEARHAIIYDGVDAKAVAETLETAGYKRIAMKIRECF